jgi:hypothetical protein
MTGLGLTQIEIANLVGISDRTLRTRYRTELNNGVAEANMRVAASLFALATKEKNVAACIWWTKARMGWKEAQDLNVGGNGQPVAVAFHWASAATSQPAPPTIEAETEANSPLVVQWRDT